MMAIVLIGGLVGMLLVSCSILLPLIIPLFSTYKDNLKSLIGIVIQIMLVYSSIRHMY